MNETEKRRLTDYLATAVCGWTRDGDDWLLPNGGRANYWGFSPLDDASDTEIVAESWCRDDGELYICRKGLGAVFVTARGCREWHLVQENEYIAIWRHAVCLAIARASGWREGE